MKRQIGFYPRYDRLGASSRYRFFLPVKAWQKELAALPPHHCLSGGSCAHCPAAAMAGGHCVGNGAARPELHLHPGVANGYLRRLYQARTLQTGAGLIKGGRDWPSRIAGGSFLLRRLAMIPFLEEHLVIEYELFPWFSADFELKVLKSHRFILNFDDDVWEKYRENPALADKFDRLCEAADGVIVANDFLYSKVRPFNDRVILIPTVPDLAEYPPASSPLLPEPPVQAIWIGTPVTYGYLQQALQELQALSCANPELELQIVAAAALAKTAPLPGVRAHYWDWSAETEKRLLAQAQFGIMPLPQEERFARGKSAFKLIQYAAAGLPSIASTVGENCRVLEIGRTGFLADSPQEWAEAGKTLLNNADLRKQMGAAARKKAETEYSLAVQFPRWQAFILETFF